MRYWYNVEIQMLGECEVTDFLVSDTSESLGFKETDVDEREAYRFTAVFSSDDVSPTAIQASIHALLYDRPEIFYIDLLYKTDAETAPKRITFWQDGRVQRYKTHVIYEEVE